LARAMVVQMAKKDDRWISLSTTAFNKADIETIKQIKGRKWQPEGKVADSLLPL